MKKVFLLLTSALFGVAAIAGPLVDQTKDGKRVFTIPYNSYGNGKQWQGGEAAGAAILTQAYFEGTGEGTYAPQVGDAFSFSMKGTTNFTGIIKMGIIDERGDVDYWQDFGSFGSHEINVVAGEEFTDMSALIITQLVATNPDKPDYLGKELTTADLVIVCEMADEAAVEAFGGTDNPCVITWEEFAVGYEEPIEAANPFSLAYQKKTDDFYQYQGVNIEKVTPNKGKFVNVDITFTPKADIESIQYALVDNTENAYNPWWGVLTTEDGSFKTFASKLEKDKSYHYQFSLPIVKDFNETNSKIVSALFAESENFASQIV